MKSRARAAPAPLAPRRPFRSSIHGELVAELRRMIVEHALPPGSRIAEAELCAAFGVSRTPLREALKALASERLVTLQPFRGAVVTGLSAERIAHLFEAQAILESQAARLAATRASAAEIAAFARKHRRMVRLFERGDRKGYFALNQELHADLVALSGNEVLVEAHAAVLVQVERARLAALDVGRRWSDSVAQHAAILAALADRDAERLATTLHDHVVETGAALAARPGAP